MTLNQLTVLALLVIDIAILMAGFTAMREGTPLAGIILVNIFLIIAFGLVTGLINGEKFTQALKSNDTTQFSVIEQSSIPVEVVDINNIHIDNTQNTYNITYIVKDGNDYNAHNIELDTIKIDPSKDSDCISTIQYKGNKRISFPKSKTKIVLIINDENHFEELVNKSSISQQNKELIKKLVEYNAN